MLQYIPHLPRVVFALFFVLAAPALAGNATLTDALAEKSIGSADAPVTIVEYASLTCPHCAAFHRDTLPKITKNYIDTGKVRLVYHDFPLDTLAMAAAMIARCGGEKYYFAMLGDLFATQETWAKSDNPLQALTNIARLSGMSKTDVESCVDDKALFSALKDKADKAGREQGIRSTPTFFVNGTKVPGNLPYDDFKEIINTALAAKN